jgi:pyrroloquinoline quinone biosynthesis protein D
MTARTVLAASSCPRLAGHVRFKFDEVRQKWVLLAPERVLMPDDIAVEILKRLDGVATVGAIAADLAAHYQAPEAEVAKDVAEMLQDLTDKGVLVA